MLLIDLHPLKHSYVNRAYQKSMANRDYLVNLLRSAITKCIKKTMVIDRNKACTVHSGYSGHVYSGLSDIVVTFTSTKYIYSIIFRSDIAANLKGVPRGGHYIRSALYYDYHGRIAAGSRRSQQGILR